MVGYASQPAPSLRNPKLAQGESNRMLQDPNTAARRVRLVCVFMTALVRTRLPEVAPLLMEAQAFCIQFSRVRFAIPCPSNRDSVSTGVRLNRTLRFKASDSMQQLSL